MPNNVDQDEINSILWNACNTLRGTATPSEYTTYILAMLFVKYLSDAMYDDNRLGIKYLDNSDQLKYELPIKSFTLPKGSDFQELYHKRNAPDLGEQINRTLAAIEDANKEKLGGVFGNIDFNSESSLGRTAARNRWLKSLLESFNDERLDFRPSHTQDLDVVGSACEYLIERFASEGGRRYGEFFTPPEVSKLMAELIDPQSGDRIYDPTCGSGSLLMQCAKQVKNGDSSIWGQEMNYSTWTLCILNLILHNIDVSTHNIQWADTLREPRLLENNDLMRFNVVVANPPMSLQRWGAESAEKDKYNRFWRGLPPNSRGDYAFILHMIESTFRDVKENGRICMIVPHGVLSRGDSEGLIRKNLIEENVIDTVIGLPSNLLYGTGIPSVILIFKRHRRDRDILFIDASSGFKTNKYRNTLSSSHIQKIVETYQTRKSIENYAYLAPYEEIVENDFNLSISQYIYTIDDSEAINFVSDCPAKHDVFISYSRRDIEHMKRISERFINAGLRVWTDENLDPGTADWQTAIEDAIENTCCVVALLSPDAKSSVWVKRELMYANEHKKHVFPILIKGDTTTSVPLLLIDAQYTDLQFDYETRIEGILNSLKLSLGVRAIKSPFLYDLWNNDKTRNWERIQIRHLIEYCSPAPIIPQLDKNSGEKYPQYDTKGIDEHLDTYDFDGSFLIIPKIMNGRTNSAIRRIDGKFSVKGEWHILKARDGYSLDFIFYTLRVTDLRPYIESGSTIPRLNKRQLESIRIVVPSYEQQIKIANYINQQMLSLDTWRTKLEKQLRILDERPVGIIQRAFTEEIG